MPVSPTAVVAGAVLDRDGAVDDRCCGHARGAGDVRPCSTARRGTAFEKRRRWKRKRKAVARRGNALEQEGSENARMK